MKNNPVFAYNLPGIDFESLTIAIICDKVLSITNEKDIRICVPLQNNVKYTKINSFYDGVILTVSLKP